MAQAGGAQREPSMEEILASIRRIIEDSDGARRPDELPSHTQPANDAAGPEAVAADIVAALESQPGSVIEVESFRADLRSRAAVAEPKADAFPAIVRFDPADEAPAATGKLGASARHDEWRLGVPVEEMVQDHHGADAFADEIASAVFDELDDAPVAVAPTTGLSVAAAEPPRSPLLSEHAGKQVAAAFGELSEAFAARSRKNLDEMAEAMLRPLLQDWLDNNLPLLVEKLVREEIERVARGA